MNKSSPSLMEILSQLADPTATCGSSCRQDIGKIKDKLKGMVALIKQVRDISDMISEHEGVNAVVRDSLGQDNTMLSCPSPLSLLLFLALVTFVFLSRLLSRLGNEARRGSSRKLRSLRDITGEQGKQDRQV